MNLRILELRAADGAGGGPEKTILRGARLSDPAEFQIHIVYLTGKSGSAEDIQLYARNLGVGITEMPSAGMLDFSQWSRLKEYVAENNIQLVHSHEYKSNFFAWKLRRSFPELKLLSTAHGWTGNSWKERLVYYPVDKRLLRSFPQVISVSSDITRELVSKGVQSTRIRTVPNAIEPDEFQRNDDLRNQFRSQNHLDPQALVIGAAGRLERQKRFDLLIDAVHKIVRGTAEDRIRLMIAGEGSLKSSLTDQIERLGLGKHVTLLGHVSDIRAFFCGIDLFVQASDYEGTSNAVLEAMAMEVPIVATDAGGTRDVVDDQKDAVVVETGSSDQLAKAIESLVNDPDRARTLRRNARQRIETELSFGRRNQVLEQTYRELLQPSSRNSPALIAR